MISERFEQARRAALERTRGGIGTLGEMGIHSTLKYYCEPDESCHEISIGSYVADIVNEVGITEIQSAGFGRMRAKLEAFLEYSPVTVVYPCVVSKRIIMLEPKTGEVISKRKSPRKGSVYDIVPELWSIAGYLGSESLSIRIILLEADEIRERCEQYRPKGRRRRMKTYKIIDKYPTAFLDELWLRRREDYGLFLPEGLPGEFTTADIRQRLPGLDSLQIQSTVNLLCRIGAAERIGRKGRAYLYRMTGNSLV